METDEGWRKAGEAVRDERGARHWTQQDLAAQADLDVSVIQDIELGRGGGRAPTSLSRVDKAFGWAPGRLRRIATGEEAEHTAALEARLDAQAERASALEAQVAAQAEQITTLLAHVSQADARHDAEVQRVSDEVRQLSRLVERLAPRDE